MNTESHDRQAMLSWMAAVAMIVLLAGCGRSYPQMESYEAVQLIAALRTACSSRNMDRLEKAAAAIERERSEGQLTEDQYRALAEIISTAQQGNWQAAEQMCYRFQKAQVR